MMLISMILKPVMFRSVLLARSKAKVTASSKLFGEPAMTSVTLATLPIAIKVSSCPVASRHLRLEYKPRLVNFESLINGLCQALDQTPLSVKAKSLSVSDSFRGRHAPTGRSPNTMGPKEILRIFLTGWPMRKKILLISFFLPS
jgi:hypothetical protein